MKLNNKHFGLTVAALLSLSALSGCYDLTELSQDPYAIADKSQNSGGNGTQTGEETEYSDVDINYILDPVEHAEALAQCRTDLQSAGSIFREYLYQGYYNDYQISTNLTHDIYAGYSANNNPGFIYDSPAYAYKDGWSATRWNHFYNDRSAEYRKLLRAFKFGDAQQRYNNMYYVTRIYYVFLALANTDTYGDMPFKVYASALLPESGNVPYESQEEVYDGMFRILQQALENIRPDDGTQAMITEDDICYKGDIYKWLRFANTLRLRMALRISNVAPERARKEAVAALSNPYGLLQSEEDNMTTVPKHAPANMGGIDAGGDENVFAMCSYCYNGDMVMNQDLELHYRNLSTGGGRYTIKQGRNGQIEKVIDPRCLVCWFRIGMTTSTLAAAEESLRQDFVGKRTADINATMLSPNQYSLTRTKNPSKDLDPAYYFAKSRPSVWLGYAESLFLRAEAALRGWGGGSPEDLFRQGIAASMNHYQINPSDAQDYIDNLVVLNDGTFSSGDNEKILEAIITQKWLAVFPNGNEGWAEFRRTDYPRLQNPATNFSGDVPQGKFIKRLLYPNSENNNQAFTTNGELQSRNTQGTRLWWDVSDTNDGSGNRLKPNNFR